jgi:hypothetical protein
MTVESMEDELMKTSITRRCYRRLKVDWSGRAKLLVDENPAAHLIPTHGGQGLEMMESLLMQEHLETRLSIQSSPIDKSRLSKA